MTNSPVRSPLPPVRLPTCTFTPYSNLDLVRQHGLDASDGRCASTPAIYTRPSESDVNSLRLYFSALITPPEAVTNGGTPDLDGYSTS
jgi:hypothetical protein